MPVKYFRPLTAGQRLSSVDMFTDVTKRVPEKKLTISRPRKAGRSLGKIAVRHRGGGAKRRTRIIDGVRERYDIPATVVAVEYDPNRGARLALVQYPDGEKRYIICPSGLTVGKVVISSRTRGEIHEGYRYPLEFIPIGHVVHEVEMSIGKGAQIARGAGCSVQLMAIDGGYAHLKLPSGEIRMVAKECMATIGSVSNPDHRLVRLGKAGRSRHLGIRPTVRGKVMNPVDHPHGGGEGKNSIGLPHPKTAQGKPALGVKTRRKQVSDIYIVSRRPPGRFSRKIG